MSEAKMAANFRKMYCAGLIICTLSAAGCGGGPGSPKPPKELLERTGTLSKIIGKITLNGQPSKTKIGVPVFREGAYKEPVQVAITDQDGSFHYSTIVTADGLPVGKYVLGAYWGNVLLNGTYGGDDKFKGKFLNPTNPVAKFEVVAGGKPIDLGTIDLQYDIPLDTPPPSPFDGFDPIPGIGK